MSSIERSDSQQLRIRVLFLVIVSFFGFLAVILMREQVLHASKYRTSSEKQSMRRVRVSAQRGRILDRNGHCLADNRPSFCIALYIEELRQAGRWKRTVARVMSLLDEVEQVIGIEKQISEADVYSHIRKRLPLPLIAWRDVDQKVLARLSESGIVRPGLDIYFEPVRVYPAHKYTAHVVGYVGKADIDEDQYHFYMPEMEGRRGVEKVYNGLLAGAAGGKLLRVDASGFKYDEQMEREAVQGRDLVLTIDLNIQKALSRALEGVRGAAVVMDPRNGNVLALVSSPSFNPNLFSPSITATDWKLLNRDENVPLLNRAVSGLYAPGSTFKPITAIAAMEAAAAGPGSAYDCPGYYQLGNVTFRCWKKTGHGVIGMRKAIEQSCNTYFCQIGMRAQVDSIYKTAEATGLGRITGIDLDGEQSGLLPNDAWKRKAMHDGWRSGDTCNMSIGQGALLVTPVQMAVVVSALANKGLIYRPRLVARMPEEGELLKKISWPPAVINVVRDGMHDVIEAETGTGKRAKVEGVEMAGKTGTAEYGSRENRKNNTWMTAFAPFDEPRYAMAVVVQDGESGGKTCAPIVHTVMKEIFEREQGRSGWGGI